MVGSALAAPASGSAARSTSVHGAVRSDSVEPVGSPLMSTPEAVVFDLGDVLIRWEPQRAIAAALGDEEARRFLAAGDFDFHAWNREQDAGRSWSEAEALACRTHPHWQP